MIERNTVDVFWKAGNGLFLDLRPGYTGVCFYKLSKPGRYILCIPLYLRFEKKFPPKNVIERKICDVEILMRFELLWMKNLIF